MLEIIREWIKNILVIVIIATLLDFLLPSSSLKRYVETVLGLFIIVTILSPVVNVFHKDFTFNQAIWKEFNNVGEDVKDQGIINDDNKDTILQSFKRRVCEQTKRIALSDDNVSAADAQVEIEENPNKENFATIKDITLTIKIGKKEEGNEVAAIAPVVISTDQEEKPITDKVGANNTYLKVEERITKKISDYWGVKPESVNIKVTSQLP